MEAKLDLIINEMREMREIRAQMNSMGSRLNIIQSDIEKIKSRHSIIDKNEMDIEYIKRNIELGTYKPKSFWKDNWYLSYVSLPIIQVMTSYITTYTSKDKCE